MATAGRRRGTGTAEPPEVARGRLTRKLFAIYDQYPRFRMDLRRLADGHRAAIAACAPRETRSPSGEPILEISWTGEPLPGQPVFTMLSLDQAQFQAADDPSLAAYVEALDAFAAKWGLDRLGAVSLSKSPYGEPWSVRPGVEAVHDWCIAAHGAGPAGLSFGFGHLISSSVAEVDTTVRLGDFVARWDPEDESLTDHGLPVPERLRTDLSHNPAMRVLTIRRRQEWRLTGDGAKTRIKKAAEKAKGRRLTPQETTELDEQLARIEAAFASAGRVTSDTAPAEDLHLRWTFRRLAPVGRDGRPQGVWEIALDAGADEKTIRNETDKMRRRLGVDRFPTAPRKPEHGPRSKTSR